MKKRITTLLWLLLLCLTLNSQPPDPPDPGNDPPIGGNLPIGSGLSIFSILSVGYLSVTAYKNRQKLIE